MSESQSHKQAKRRAAGRKGKTEANIKGNRRIDAVTQSGKRATEVERSSNVQALAKAVRRLRGRRSKQKVLQVPQKNMSKAAQAMKQATVKGTVKNMKGSKRRSV